MGGVFKTSKNHMCPELKLGRSIGVIEREWGGEIGKKKTTGNSLAVMWQMGRKVRERH